MVDPQRKPNGTTAAAIVSSLTPIRSGDAGGARPHAPVPTLANTAPAQLKQPVITKSTDTKATNLTSTSAAEDAQTKKTHQEETLSSSSSSSKPRIIHLDRDPISRHLKPANEREIDNENTEDSADEDLDGDLDADGSEETEGDDLSEDFEEEGVPPTLSGLSQAQSVIGFPEGLRERRKSVH
jgi:hypothetical protein